MLVDDIKKFIKDNKIKSKKDLRENYSVYYSRYIKLPREERSSIVFDEEFYHIFKNELDTVSDFQNFIENNKIDNPKQFRTKFPKEYDRLCRVLSKSDKKLLIYPNRRNSYEGILSTSDLQKFIDENSICSRKDLHKRFSGLYVKFQHTLDEVSFEKSSISVGENKVRLLLLDNNIEYETQKTFPELKNKLPLRFDFYIPSCNLLIEHQGEGHFGKGRYYSKELIENDIIKFNFAKFNNINIIYFTIYKSEYNKYGYFTDVITDINVLLEKIKELLTKTN